MQFNKIVCSVSSDPYLEEELDPMKTKAIESSLWELKTLENHVLPQVSNAVNFMNKPLPNTEWDLTTLIEKTYNDVNISNLFIVEDIFHDL